MRFILWVALILGAIWGGYWFVGSRSIEQAVTGWFDDSAAQGLEATNEGVAVQGFPSRFDLTVTRPRLADPATGFGWKAPFAQVFAMTWKPWHVISVLPPDQEIDLPGERVALTTTHMAASLRLSPSTDLTFTEAVLETTDLALKSDGGWSLGLASAVLALGRSPTEARDYRLGLEVKDLRPDPALAAALPDLGEVMSRAHLDVMLQLTAPLDRQVGEARPQLAGLELKDLQITWGALQLTASGSLAAGADGLAEGQIDLAMKGWRQVPQLAAALGLIAPEIAKSLNDGLAYMAAADGDPETLSLPLTLLGGRMTLGPLPLGPAPMLAQRQ